MALYRSILIVVDLSDEADTIARRGRALARALDADVRLIHVIPLLTAVPPIPPEPVVPVAVQTEAELLDDARGRMAKLAAELDVPPERREVVVGEVRNEIVRAARTHQADLIVLGSHERNGRALLAHFSVEDRVLHRAPCDVLAVRVP